MIQIVIPVVMGLLCVIGLFSLNRWRKLLNESSLANSLLEVWQKPDSIPCRCGRGADMIECPCRLAMLRAVTNAHLRIFLHRAPAGSYEMVFAPTHDEEIGGIK